MNDPIERGYLRNRAGQQAAKVEEMKEQIAELQRAGDKLRRYASAYESMANSEVWDDRIATELANSCREWRKLRGGE